MDSEVRWWALKEGQEPEERMCPLLPDSPEKRNKLLEIDYNRNPLGQPLFGCPKKRRDLRYTKRQQNSGQTSRKRMRAQSADAPSRGLTVASGSVKQLRTLSVVISANSASLLCSVLSISLRILRARDFTPASSSPPMASKRRRRAVLKCSGQWHLSG